MKNHANAIVNPLRICIKNSLRTLQHRVRYEPRDRAAPRFDRLFTREMVAAALILTTNEKRANFPKIRGMRAASM